jgi:hypothetical protein
VSTHAHLGTAGRGTRKGTVGCEWAGGAACRRDTVTFCLSISHLVPQVTVSDDSTIFSELALLHSESDVEIRILPFELWPSSIKADGEETRQSSYNVWVSLTWSLQKTVYAAAATLCRLPSSQDAVSKAHGLTQGRLLPLEYWRSTH